VGAARGAVVGKGARRRAARLRGSPPPPLSLPLPLPSHAAAFAFFTFCNIGPRGAQHHAFYLEKFKDSYPAARKAVIPFLW
jgi:hypothetical protein